MFSERSNEHIDETYYSYLFFIMFLYGIFVSRKRTLIKNRYSLFLFFPLSRILFIHPAFSPFYTFPDKSGNSPTDAKMDRKRVHEQSGTTFIPSFIPPIF